MFQYLAAAALFGRVATAQVTATGTMGVTNPTAAVMGTPVNQSSDARLLSLNSINDFCIFSPPTPGHTIGDSEQEQVAWCVQPRNNARVIPDGTLTAVHFVRTPLYYQVQGWGDFTRLGITLNDQGGELDPHGATGDGNPIGGNVTCNATGADVNYEEWMNYMSFQQFCLRICIAETNTVSASIQCQHTLDEMGCAWVMPGDYTNNSFTDCKADAAAPPGVYPLAGGGESTFAQRYTLTQTQDGHLTRYTIGQTVTPPAPFSTPASSECTTYTSVGNGIPIASLGVNAAFSVSGFSSPPGSALPSASASGSVSGDASAAAPVTTTDAQGQTITSAAAAAANTANANASGGASAASKPNGAAAATGYSGAFAVVLAVVAVGAGVGVTLV